MNIWKLVALIWVKKLKFFNKIEIRPIYQKSFDMGEQIELL